jgi:hypothetical protein
MYDSNSPSGKKAGELIREIAKEYELTPAHTADSAEDGTYLLYKVGERRVEFEIYNDDLSVAVFKRVGRETVKLCPVVEWEKFDLWEAMEFLLENEKKDASIS